MTMPTSFRVLLFVSLCLIPAAACAWEVPSHWAELGTVDEWMRRDGEIWRFEGDGVFNDRSQKNVDQRKVYEGTGSTWAAWRGSRWRTSWPCRRTGRRIASAPPSKHRDYLLRFRDRMDNYVNQSRADQPIAWGADVADVMTIGEHLQHLWSLVAMDPANVHAWHIYALFSTIAGDTDRALGALGGAEAALAEVPAGELKDVRARVALDRAWLLRDKGDLAGANAALETAVADGAPQTGNDPAARAPAGPGRRDEPRGRRPGQEPCGAWRSASGRSERPSPGRRPASGGPSGRTWAPGRRSLRSISRAGSWPWSGSRRADRKCSARPSASISVKDIYPLGWRFWREAGRIYEISGRPELAHKAWMAARVWAPYSAFYPVKAYVADLSRLTGRPTQHAVYLAFDTFYIAGHRLVPGAVLAQQVATSRTR